MRGGSKYVNAEREIRDSRVSYKDSRLGWLDCLGSVAGLSLVKINN